MANHGKQQAALLLKRKRARHSSLASAAGKPTGCAVRGLLGVPSTGKLSAIAWVIGSDKTKSFAFHNSMFCVECSGEPHVTMSSAFLAENCPEHTRITPICYEWYAGSCA